LIEAAQRVLLIDAAVISSLYYYALSMLPHGHFTRVQRAGALRYAALCCFTLRLLPLPLIDEVASR